MIGQPENDRDSALTASLETLGFRRRTNQVYTIALDLDLIGWLGLNRATRHQPSGRVEIFPIIGVRHQVLERIVAKLQGRRFHDYSPPSVSTPLGYVMPSGRYTSWAVDDPGASKAAGEIHGALTDYGIPFMRALQDLAELRKAMESGLGHQLEYRLPVLLRIMGDKDAASDALHAAVDRLGSRSDEAASELRTFAARFHDWADLSAL